MKKGFTLLELLIVVVIIGVLALIAAPSLLNATTRAKEGVVKANVAAAASTVTSQFAINTNVTATNTALAAFNALNPNNTTSNPFTVNTPAFVQNATTAGTVSINGAGSKVTIIGYGATDGSVVLTKVIDAPTDN